MTEPVPSARRPIRIGIDIGGTFTDLQILDERNGATASLKTATTPEDPSIGLMRGLKEAGQRFGFALGDIGYLLHGTTIATNAVLERKLPQGVLVTTAGFEDVLEIGRHNRRDVYGLRAKPTPPLIPRDRRLGVAERITASGRIEQALAEGEITRLLGGSMRLPPRRSRSSCSTPISSPATSGACAMRSARRGPTSRSRTPPRSAPRSASTSAARRQCSTRC